MQQSIRFVVLFLFLLSPVFGNENPSSGIRWQVFELSFRTDAVFQNPYAEVDLKCRFEGPNGLSYDMAGFFDGDGIWKIRFCPTDVGSWTWKTTCTPPDKSLHEKTGTFDVASPPENGTPLQQHGGILAVGEDQHHLTYSDGTPFFWLGDTWWFCPGNKVPIDGSTHPDDPSMYRTLIDKRKNQGFTIVHLASLGGFGNHADFQSFIRTKNGGSFDPNYWKQYDRYIQTANEAGIVPVIGFGFHTGVDPFSLEELEYLWRYVLARYGASSVTWLICGEYNQNGGDRENRIAKVLQLGAFIKKHDPYRRAMTVHPWYFKGDTRDAWNRDWYDFVMWQGAHVSHNRVPPTQSYYDSAKLGKPYIEGETQYEGIYGGRPNAVTADDVRVSAWHAMQAGCCGYTYGAHGLWYPTQNAEDKTFAKDWGEAKPWWEAMQHRGADDLTILKRFYGQLDWTRLRPGPDRLKLEGEYDDATRPLLQNAEDKIVVIYLPPRSGADRNVGVRLAPGKYAAEWFNPRDGKRTEAAAITAPEDFVRLPNRPDENDWVLTLRRESR